MLTFQYLLQKEGIKCTLVEGVFVDLAGKSKAGHSLRTEGYWKHAMAVIMKGDDE